MPWLGVALLGFLALTAEASEPLHSSLWGAHGEKWHAASRLPDFSHAGRRGVSSATGATTSVKDFGAVGDGVTDDTEAFRRALREAPPGVIRVPPGRYLLSRPLRINRSGLTLRGEDAVLVCPQPLSVVEPLPSRDSGKARYAFTGGYIVMEGKDAGTRCAIVTAPARRGDRRLVLSKVAGLKVGDLIRLEMNDSDGSLGRHLHADLLDASPTTLKEMKPLVSWVAGITRIDGDTISLDRPLRLDVRPEWTPVVFTYRPTLAGSSIEDLTIEFPGLPKKPHLLEEGFNAIHLRGAFDCLVKNITVIDADNAVIVGGFSRHCTIEGIRVLASRREGITGHHALWVTGGSQDCLFRDFRIETPYVHDLSVEGRANGNVFSRGSGVSLNFDHHRNAPYENLFSALHVGQPRRIWKSSGRGDRGPHSAARGTFWNISGDGKFPTAPAWPQINLIGVPAAPPSRKSDPHHEASSPVSPPDLFEAQQKNRLSTDQS